MGKQTITLFHTVLFKFSTLSTVESVGLTILRLTNCKCNSLFDWRLLTVASSISSTVQRGSAITSTNAEAALTKFVEFTANKISNTINKIHNPI